MPTAAPMMVHHAKAAIGMAWASTSRLTSAALAMAAKAVVATVAVAPAMAPPRTRDGVCVGRVGLRWFVLVAVIGAPPRRRC